MLYRAYADVSNLDYYAIQPGVDGQKWIFINRQKTDSLSRIPLLPFALKLIDKYRHHPKCLQSGKVFPILSNQKMNSYLKEIALICGIVKNLTYHTARHTFATTITLSNGVPIKTVADMLGHKSLKQTQHYAKLVDRRIGDDMALLRTKLSIEPVSSEDLNITVKTEPKPSSPSSKIKYNYVVK